MCELLISDRPVCIQLVDRSSPQPPISLRNSESQPYKLMKYSRSLIATLLIGGSLSQLVSPALAIGTAAGESLSNTATASYEDPTDPLKPLNTTSNTVTVTVAEVAGITISADAVTKLTGTGTALEAGDTVAFDYTVTNTGNDPSKLRIAGTAGIAGPGTLQKVEYYNGTTWVEVPSGGEYISGSKAPGEFVKVRVTVQVTPGAAANSNITVTLGNTATPGEQNIPLVANGGDVYTVDNIDTASGEVVGAPANGVREASAFQSIVVGATAQAFATVTKLRDVNGVTAAKTLEYTLGLDVAGTAPIGSSKIAEDLAGTPINLDSTTTNKILVSDAVPAGTKAKSLVAPSGWTAVYTTDPTATNANAAQWKTAPSDLSTVVGTIYRVGFVKDGTNATVAKGTSVSNFKVVVELLTPASGLKIGNIAQIFGSTKLDTTGAPDLTKPVYDESGDNKPNNFNDDGTAPATNPITDGVVNTTTITPADSDTTNTNSGTGSAGEPNVYQYVPTTLQGVLNGTQNNPGAVGPTGNNDDFTNKSTGISTTDATRVDGALPTIDPSAVSFANTFQSATNDDIKLLPQVGNLPVGTTVTLNYGGNSKVYVVTANGLVNSDLTVATPLLITGVVPNTKLNYGVDIDLPTGTAQLVGYSVPVVAFIDAGTAGLDAGDKQNTTIDRLYTGYLKVEKEAQILDVDGTTVLEAYTKTPSFKPAPGQMIQYRIVYTNISDAATVGSGSIGLNAQNVKVVEDGAASPNTWAVLAGGKLNTLHKATSAGDTNSGVVTFNDGAKTNNDVNVTKYVDTVAGPLTGQQAGAFTFIRVVNPN
jgi:hypothetical protein